MAEPSEAPRLPFDRRLAQIPAVRLSIAASVVLGLVSTAGIVAQAVGLAHLLASAMPGAHSVDRARWFVVLGCGFAVRGLAALAGDVVAGLGASAVKAQMRVKLLTAALSQPALDGPGAIATLAGRGLDALDVYVGRCLPDFVLAMAAPVALLGAVGVLDWPSALIMVVLLALFPIFGTLVGQASMALSAERWRRLEELGAHVADTFQGMPVLRAFGRSRAQRERIAQLNEELGRSSAKVFRVAFLSALVLDTLGSFSVALVAVPLGLRLLSGSVSLSAALAVLAVSPEVFAPLRRASAEFHESTEGLAAVARVMEVSGNAVGAVALPVQRRHRYDPARATSATNTPDFVQKRDRCEPRPTTSSAFLYAAPQAAPEPQPGRLPDPRDLPVAFRSVTVVLPGRPAPLLAGANLTIEPGEMVALVGPSGSGKSTVVSLLAGFQVPTAGAVTIGDTDLRDLDLRSWRQLLTYMPEHPTLLAATLADNLRLANAAATDEELLEALAQVAAPAMATSLRGGLGAQLGEGAQSLSAGELQRVALARVVLRPASLYILDEPTVHLDQASEQQALTGLRRAIAGSSALIVSHRPAVAMAADRVVALRDGALVEVGAPELTALVPA